MFNFDVNALVAQLQPAVSAAAAALGTNAEHLWEIGIKAQITKGIASALGAVLCLVPFLFVPGVIQWIRKNNATYLYPSFLLLIPLTIILGGLVYSAILHLVAPEYTLLLEILGKI